MHAAVKALFKPLSTFAATVTRGVLNSECGYADQDTLNLYPDQAGAASGFVAAIEATGCPAIVFPGALLGQEIHRVFRAREFVKLHESSRFDQTDMLSATNFVVGDRECDEEVSLLQIAKETCKLRTRLPHDRRIFILNPERFATSDHFSLVCNTLSIYGVRIQGFSAISYTQARETSGIQCLYKYEFGPTGNIINIDERFGDMTRRRVLWKRKPQSR